MISIKNSFVLKPRSRNGNLTVTRRPVSNQPKRVQQRVITLAVSFTAIIVAAGFGLPWAYYRLRHVVTHEAMIVGNVTPIGARLDGQLKLLEIKPGERVRHGDLLARLEDRPLRARVDETAANLQRAIAEHTAQIAYVDQQRKVLHVQVQRAKADMELAASRIAEVESQRPRWEREFERTASVLPTKAVTQSEMDEVRASRDATRASMETAKIQHRTAEIEYARSKIQLEGIAFHESQLVVLAAKIEVARRELATAQANLEAAEIRAPQDGWVVKTIVGPGASVKVGQPILTFWNSEQFFVQAHVDETAISQVKIGAAADVTLPAYRGNVFAGHVVAICPVSNDVDQPGPPPHSPLFPHGNHFCVWIELDDVDKPLLPGLSAVVGVKR